MIAKSSSVYEQREAQKRRWQLYRDAAARLYPDAFIRELVAVNETADGDSAFVEMTVQIPHSEIQPADAQQLLLDWSQEIDNERTGSRSIRRLRSVRLND